MSSHWTILIQICFRPNIMYHKNVKGLLVYLSKSGKRRQQFKYKKMYKYPEKYDMMIKEHFLNKFRLAVSPHLGFLLR